MITKKKLRNNPRWESLLLQLMSRAASWKRFDRISPLHLFSFWNYHKNLERRKIWPLLPQIQFMKMLSLITIGSLNTSHPHKIIVGRLRCITSLHIFYLLPTFAITNSLIINVKIFDIILIFLYHPVHNILWGLLSILRKKQRFFLISDN